MVSKNIPTILPLPVSSHIVVIIPVVISTVEVSRHLTEQAMVPVNTGRVLLRRVPTKNCADPSR